MSIELKIKSKHLALEPAIIRKEERKIINHIRSGRSNDTAAAFRKYESLHIHRKWNVRNEARATELARAYISGKPYTFVEQKRKDENEYKFLVYIVPRIVAMVNKYSKDQVDNDKIRLWSKLG
jgi:hypothetical protein